MGDAKCALVLAVGMAMTRAGRISNLRMQSGNPAWGIGGSEGSAGDFCPNLRQNFSCISADEAGLCASGVAAEMPVFGSFWQVPRVIVEGEVSNEENQRLNRR